MAPCCLLSIAVQPQWLFTADVWLPLLCGCCSWTDDAMIVHSVHLTCRWRCAYQYTWRHASDTQHPCTAACSASSSERLVLRLPIVSTTLVAFDFVQSTSNGDYERRNYRSSTTQEISKQTTVQQRDSKRVPSVVWFWTWTEHEWNYERCSAFDRNQNPLPLCEQLQLLPALMQLQYF